MTLVKIDKKQWAKGLETLQKAYRLFGPSKEKDYFSFKALEAGEQPELGFSNSRLSPKALLFPQSEAIIEFSLDENAADHHIMKPIETDSSPRVVLGIRPCDAKAVNLVNMNFDTPEYQDPYWAEALAATTLVGMACDEPRSTCFCTSTGCGPYNEEGLDLLLIDADDNYLAKVLTDKGQTLVKAAGWNSPAGKAAEIEARKAAAEAKITSTVAMDNLKNQDLMELHGASFWEDIAFACVNCGTCTFTCPTCWCFDLQDEVHGKTGKRMKNWDSCMFPLFTQHTTGHNPRGTKTQRLRQRFMHKLKYFVDKYDKGIMCVGCGRCVSQCPVNIDIRTVCDLMNSYKAAETACTVQE
jgi:sulfhydrogenase subunit beta (sulfur reductase)